jgi:hypothetical protein
MPAARYFEIQRQLEFQKMNVTAEVLKEKLETFFELVNSNRVGEAIGVIAELRERLNLVVELETTLNIVALFFIREDEINKPFSFEKTKEKVQFLLKDASAQDFFLLELLKTLYNLPTSSALELKNYLRVNDYNVKLMNQFFSSLKSSAKKEQK